MRLRESLPILPSLLTDGRSSIASAASSDNGSPAKLLGTGPFLVALHTPDGAVLDRNRRYWREPARVDRIEFRASLSASTIAQGLRSGELDIARDLRPQD